MSLLARLASCALIGRRTCHSRCPYRPLPPLLQRQQRYSWLVYVTSAAI